jgi:hypothetical protein
MTEERFNYFKRHGVDHHRLPETAKGGGWDVLDEPGQWAEAQAGTT